MVAEAHKEQRACSRGAACPQAAAAAALKAADQSAIPHLLLPSTMLLAAMAPRGPQDAGLGLLAATLAVACIVCVPPCASRTKARVGR